MKPFHSICDQANGNHFSGKDNKIDNWNISNKSVKIDKGKVSISSYRLTTVCSNSNLGNIQDILNEINKRDKSYDYYSMIARESGEKIVYKWYIIPKNFKLVNPNKQNWVPKFGKQGPKKGLQNGWKSENMEIVYSMSSQLWIYINIEDIEKYKIHEIIVDKKILPKITYSDLYDKYMN